MQTFYHVLFFIYLRFNHWKACKRCLPQNLWRLCQRLAQVSNQYLWKKNRCPRRKSSKSCFCEDVSQVLKLFGGPEAAWKTPGRQTAKEEGAPKLQPKVRVASQKNCFCSVKEYKILLHEANTCVVLLFVLRRLCGLVSFAFAFVLHVSLRNCFSKKSPVD